MNPLIDKLPTKIKVGNEVIDINADFRNCLQIILAYEDNDLTIQEKHLIMVQRLYKVIPGDIEQAILQGIKFLNCGETSQNTSEKRRVYSFSKDAKYIYSAVSQASNVDLETVCFFHWWKFFYYFLDISNDCTFSNIVSLRQKKKKGKLTEEEKKAYIESIEILDINYEEVKEESDFMKAFNGGE
ncbi:MAG: hypothetical protein HFI09_04825 [Bacilli bacterium]|nr:hypothetical protein [Bacilli bacterium]